MNAPYANNDEPIENEQQGLLAAIWSDDAKVIAQSGFDVDGINVYRRNLLANAERALSISFPTVFELLDSDVSQHIAHQFLKSSPPNQGDWAQWGAALAGFISTTEVGYEYPYLADCAALDWQVHCALHGIDQTFEQSSLQLLGDCQPEHIIVKFNANVKLLETKYPIGDIFYAHHGVDERQRKASLNNAQQALASPLAAQTVMVYRPEFQPKVATLMTGEAEFMRSLMSGQSLANALNNANGNNHFSFEHWLVKAIERNLIYTFKEN
ncbi:MAG: DNA-binding domain-containing protein [Colwellia sp.]|nr:DNA-binding domain-containing protein [Colwellia sp.]MCW8864829.1 DNA-binding domain-containing protein [Colwellia sp.]MCW9081010.1 DNA-binding domain-containing protein [Colwellia sp.]